MFDLKRGKGGKFWWAVQDYDGKNLAGPRAGAVTAEASREDYIKVFEIMAKEIGCDIDNLPKCEFHSKLDPSEIEQFRLYISDKQKPKGLKKLFGKMRREK